MKQNLGLLYSTEYYQDMSEIQVAQRFLLLVLSTPYCAEYFSLKGITFEHSTIYLN
jgi:hypothetical protein